MVGGPNFETEQIKHEFNKLVELMMAEKIEWASVEILAKQLQIEFIQDEIQMTNNILTSPLATMQDEVMTKEKI
jgi:hypothetical protein